MAPTVGIIGAGGMGLYLKGVVESIGWRLGWMAGRSTNLESLAQVDLVFLTISTRDKGEAALSYILFFVTRGIPVVTCEKGALAYYAPALVPHLRRIGYNAACGGGVGLLAVLQEYNVRERPDTLFDVVLNASLHEIFSWETIPKGCEVARKKHLLEPNGTDVLSALNGELGDALKKACVLFNTVLARHAHITPSLFAPRMLKERDCAYLEQHMGEYRFVVTFTNYESGLGRKRLLGGFEGRFGAWSIKAGFRRIPKGDFWLPNGAYNGVFLAGRTDPSGKFCKEPICEGLGAGYGPTTSIMIKDAKRLLNI